MTLPFDIRLILRSGLFGGSSAAAWRYHATWHNSFLILLVFVLRFLFGCLALFSFILHCLILLLAVFVVVVVVIVTVVVLVIVPVVALVDFVLLLVGLLSLQHFQRFQQAASIHQSSVSSVPRPP